MSSSPHNQPSESGSPDPKLEFKTENIGHWTKKQEDPFAAQNRKKEAKKQKSAATRKKALPYIIIATAVIVLGLIVWGVVALVMSIVENANDSTRGIVDYTNTLQSVYDSHDGSIYEKIGAIEKYVQHEIDENGVNVNEITIAQALVYSDNEFYQRSASTMETVDPESLTLDQKLLYYDSLQYTNSLLGNEELADRYAQKAYEYHQEKGGKGSGGEA